METTKAEVERERKIKIPREITSIDYEELWSGFEADKDDPERKIPREITSLDDDELWSGFETEGIDRILSGETKPKTMILTDEFFPSEYQIPEDMIARELLKVFPGSKHVRWYPTTALHQIVDDAIDKCFTSLVRVKQDYLSIISLVNGAVATFMLVNFIPPQDIPGCASPTIYYPRVHMVEFTSPSSIGTSRLLQSLFPKAPLSRERTAAWFQNQDGVVFFRHFRFHFDEAAHPAERGRITHKEECGPQFALVLTSVEKLVHDTDHFQFEAVCKPPLNVYDI